MKLSPRVRRAATLLFVGAAFGFLGVVIVRNAEQIRHFDWSVRPGLLALSVVAQAGVLLWGVRIWQMVLRRFGARVRFRPLARAWLVSNLGRYIPGTIWQFVGLAHLSGSVGVSPILAVSSLAVHLGFTLLSALLLGVLLLPASTIGALAPLLEGVRWLTPAALLVVHPAPIRAALALLERVTRRRAAAWEGSWADGILFLVLTGVAWALYGGAFYLFVASLVPLSISALPWLTGANALAFVAGYLVVFAPGGIGAKEGALAFLLGGLVGGAVAAAIAIAARLWSIAAELLPILLFLRGHPAPEAAPDTAE